MLSKDSSWLDEHPCHVTNIPSSRLICVAEQNSPLPDGAIPFPPFPTPGPASFQLAASSNPSSLCKSRTYKKVMPMPSSLNIILSPLASRTFLRRSSAIRIPPFTRSNNQHKIQHSTLFHHPNRISKAAVHTPSLRTLFSQKSLLFYPTLPPIDSLVTNQPAFSHSLHLTSPHQAFLSSHLTLGFNCVKCRLFYCSPYMSSLLIMYTIDRAGDCAGGVTGSFVCGGGG